MEKNKTHVNDNSYGDVSSDTRIVLMDPTGHVIYTTASYFKCLGIGTAKLRGWKILSKDGKLTDLIKVAMWESDHINAIRVSHGTIKVTDNQIIPIYRKQKYMEIPTKDIQLHDCLIDIPLKNKAKARVIMNISITKTNVPKELRFFLFKFTFIIISPLSQKE